MARRQSVKQADVSRALKGAQRAGIKVGRLEIYLDAGKIIVVPVEDGATEPATDLDAWRAKRHARQA